MVVIVDGHGGSMSRTQCGFWLDGDRAQKAVAWGIGVENGHLGSMNDTWVTEVHVEMLVFLEDVVIDYTDRQLLYGLAWFEDQRSLSKLIIGAGVSRAILSAIVHLGKDTAQDFVVTDLRMLT